GIEPKDVLPEPPVLPRMTSEVLTLTPSYICDTTYNNYVRGGTRGFGYTSIRQAADRIIQQVRSATRPTYTHLYLPEVDSICHKLGVEHPNVVPMVMQIDAELARLAAAVAGKARIVVSADHGLIDVPREHQTLLFTGDPLLDLLVVPPSGDARMPVFHVRDGARPAFAEQFRQRFGDRMFL